MMSSIFNNIYKNKKILITGHTGFKGSWLALWLRELGAEVAGYSLLPETSPNLFDILDLKNSVRHVTGDIRDIKNLKELIDDFKPEIIFHMAAQAFVLKSYQEPLYTYETNIIGTANLFEAARGVDSIRAILNITTDKCYDNKERLNGYKEDDPLGGYDPYSSSKAGSELVTATYRNSFFNPTEYGLAHKTVISSVRAGNVIGGGDWSQDRLIPDCIRALTSQRDIVLRNPDSIRPWQYVLEPLSGYLWLGALMFDDGISYGQAWNFGPCENDSKTVGEIVTDILDLWGSGSYTVRKNKSFHEAAILRLNIEKASSFLNWKPVYNIDDALSETINWYKEYYYSKNNIINHSVACINNYVDKAKGLGLDWSL